jgi:hypothetical protein
VLSGVSFLLFHWSAINCSPTSEREGTSFQIINMDYIPDAVSQETSRETGPKSYDEVLIFMLAVLVSRS